MESLDDFQTRIRSVNLPILELSEFSRTKDDDEEEDDTDGSWRAWRLFAGLNRVALRSSFPFVHGLFEEILDLTIYAAQLVRRPGFELRPKPGIDPQQK